MRVFITGWLNSQYLRELRDTPAGAAIYFPLVVTRMRACSGAVCSPISKFFDTLEKPYQAEQSRLIVFTIRSRTQIEWLTICELIMTIKIAFLRRASTASQNCCP